MNLFVRTLFCFVLLALARASEQLETWPLPTVDEITDSHELDEWENQYVQPKGDGVPTGVEEPSSQAGVAGPSVGNRIVGGNNAARGQYPWQALIYMDGSYMCGGSLISARWVLTAAHCAKGFTSFQVGLGVGNRVVAETGRQVFSTTSRVVHSGYNPSNVNNDIALVMLPAPASVTIYVNMVRLPRSSQAAEGFINWNAIASGWGRTSDAGSTSNILQALDRRIIGNAECAQFYGTSIINSASICINAGDGKNVCNGDSGGPLVIREKDGRWTLVGVTSFVSSRGCASGAPGGFQRVSSHLSWISAYTGIAILP